MKLTDTLVRGLGLAALAVLPLAATAQTLTISNGVQTFETLTNTVITLAGRCELRVTGAGNPLSGSTVNLTSSDAWLVLPSILPSAVSGGLLSQVRVNGLSAVADGNCRVVSYVNGSLIVPQGTAFMPLQVFSAPNFLGVTASAYTPYTYYTGAALGVMNRNIGSFKLKRGYAVAFAQNTNGTGASRVYVAQDGDLAVGTLPAALDHQCSFVRVIPWRWTGKKGWGGGDWATTIVNPVWGYDWGNGATSTADREYIPMKWNGGSDTSAINNKRNSTAVLGYNEPDSSAQANMTTAQAIADWPSLMQWGLRVGAPAVSDSGVSGQGLDWLAGFMAQAASLGYRVDFIPIHYYKCGWSTAQFSNYLAGIYQQYKLPIWVTEWNNGASWCNNNISLAANAVAIGNDINMLESAPFVERYAIYSWFDVSTGLPLVTNNALTPAGQVYRDRPTTMAYAQTVPPGGSRSIAQFNFDTNTLDSSGYANNTFAFGSPGYTNGVRGSAVVLDGANSYLQLPPSLPVGSTFSFAGWVYWNGGNSWQRIFDFGNNTTQYMFLTPSSGNGTLRFAITTNGTEQIVQTVSALPSGRWIHVAVTLGGGIARLYTNGVQVALATGVTMTPAAFKPALNYFGKSQFSADPLFNGSLDEVQISDAVFTPAQIAALMTNQPPQFTTNYFSLGTAASGVPFTGSLAGTATTMPNSGGTLTYSKAGGSAWLAVAADGTLSGAPADADGGTNYFTVRATDAAGASAFAVIAIITPVTTLNGAWSRDADGLWSGTVNWSGGLVANGTGFTADFSTINITAARTVTLDTSRRIGTLRFGDRAGTQGWTLAATNGSGLTLDAGTGVKPSLFVTNTAVISAPLDGVNGLDKFGPGTLVLSGTNSLSGVTTLGGGTLRVDGVNSNITITTGTLGGHGLIKGAQIIPAGAVLSPGSPVGALTCDSSVTLQPGSTSVFELDKSTGTNDQLRVLGALAYGGTLQVTNLSAPLVNLAGGDQFKLFNAASVSGNFSALTGSPGDGLAWKFNPTNGVLTVYATTPVALQTALVDGALQITWPASHVGWILQAQTNRLDTGLGTNWVSLPGTEAATRFTVPLDPGAPSVFYRLIYP